MDADTAMDMIENPKKKKKAKREKKPKQKITEYKGISGTATDYRVYIMNSKEKLTAVLIGFAVGFAAGYCYFNNMVIGLLVGLLAGWKAIDIFRKKKQDKRLRELRLQFRDLLESLSNSYTVGATASRAFQTAYTDMSTEHGKNSYIAKEVKLINEMHDNQGREIQEMLADFAKRSGLDDIQSFAGVFAVASERGGDVGHTIRETRDMIGDKIETELEIQTMVTAQRNQLNILAVMPIVMSLLTRSFASGSDSGNAMTLIVKLVALVFFVLAYFLGTKIVDIKV